MLNKRQLEITKQLEDKGIVYLRDLSGELQVSISTIQRDFEKLEEYNFGQRVHGGFVRVTIDQRLNASTDISMETRKEMNLEEKRRLCRKCADLIDDGDCVFIDGGTTFMFITEYLEGKKVTVVTHSDLVRPAENSTLSVIVLGGQNHPTYKMNLGLITTNNMMNSDSTKPLSEQPV